MGLFDFFKNKSETELPEFIKQYLNSFESVKKNTLLQDLRFVCFDSESTSLDLNSAKLLSLAAVTVRNNQIEINNALNCFVHWEGDEKPENVEIHGVTNRQSDQGEAPEEVIELFLKYIEGAALVAHNISFDKGLFDNILQKYFGNVKLKNPMLDTARIALRLEVPRADQLNYKMDDYTLDALMKRYAVYPLERHSALGDAYSTALLFMKLMSKLKQRGLVKLGQLI